MFVRAVFARISRIVWPRLAIAKSMSTKRMVYPYDKNITSSLVSTQRHLALENHKDCHDGRFMLSFVHAHADLIEEHAARRADLFFCQLVSVHNLKKKHNAPVVIEKLPARIQHGSGSERCLTQACHSALFPHLNILVHRPNGGCLDLTGEYMRTHFYQQLNSTVELPEVVNGFDGHLEGRIKPSLLMASCLDILNRTANNEIDPRVGMNLFYQCMNQFFSVSRLHYLTSSRVENKAAIKLAISAYQQHGTFSGAKNLAVSDEYLSLMLRLKPLEKAQLQSGNVPLDSHYQQIQDEIWSTRIPPLH